MKIADISRKAKPILSSYGVTRAAVFGSTARGEAKPGSDIDILIDLKKGISLFAFIELKQKLQATLNRDVDLVQYKKIKPSLKPFIMKDAKVFYQS